jgi:hypothetical protein
MKRRIASCLAVGATLVLSNGPAHAQEEVASSPVGADGQFEYVVLPLVDAYDGVVAWSESERTADDDPRYFLTAQRDGQRMRLPVAPRGVPFDVDLGPGEDGGVVAAYSRCDREPDSFSLPQPAHTTGRGCDLYMFDFASGGETMLEGPSTDEASEVLPSIWRDEIAFARVYEQREGDPGVLPYLYTRPLAGGSSERQPGGSRGEGGLPGPVSMDLYGRRLSFVWNYSNARRETGEVSGISEVRLDTLGGGHELLSQATWEDLQYATYLSPQGADGRIFYGFQRVDGLGERPPDSVTTLLLRQRIATGERSLAQAPSQLLSSGIDGDAFVFGLADNVRSYGNVEGRIVRQSTLRFR